MGNGRSCTLLQGDDDPALAEKDAQLAHLEAELAKRDEMLAHLEALQAQLEQTKQESQRRKQLNEELTNKSAFPKARPPTGRPADFFDGRKF